MTVLAPALDAAHDSEITGQRLRAVAPALLGETPAPDADPGDLLDRIVGSMVGSVLADRAPDRVWLLLVALCGRLPTDDEVRLTLRTLELADRVSATLWLLDHALEAARAAGTASLPLEVVDGGVVVDVDHTARHDLHTGIQRVVRSTVPRWRAAHDVVETVWTPGHQALRRLSQEEEHRVHRFGEVAADTAPDPRAGAVQQPLVVPWRSTVVLIEVPVREACERLGALGQWSGNRVVAVGHDCIPVVSAGLMPLAEPERFVHYLTAVKHMATVVGVSVSATREFRGFSQMLPGQGLPGPVVVECALPVDTSEVVPTAPDAAELPMVLCVGSFEPRKNQLGLLWASEVLWREGLRFRLRFVGGGGWGSEFPRAVRRARRAGRPVEVLTTITDRALDESYRTARFTALVSLHEGYGLPVAESLARATPALVTDYGSLRETGADGGVLMVDPRDDEQVLAGMRRLLTDDALLAELTAQIARRPSRTWDDYAAELWTAFGLDGEAGRG